MCVSFDTDCKPETYLLIDTVFSLIEAPGAKTRFKGASIYSNKCTTFQNKHDKEKAERLIRNLSIIQDEK